MLYFDFNTLTILYRINFATPSSYEHKNIVQLIITCRNPAVGPLLTYAVKI